MSRYIDRYIRNEKEEARVRKIEALAARFAERAERHDREGSFPFDNFADLREAGYLSITVPKEYGGEEASLRELVLLQERLAYGDGSTALAVGWHVGQLLHLRTTRKWPDAAFAGLCRDIVADGAMINTFASEAATGSPSRGGRPETAAVPAEGGGWRITGRKTFSTLSPILDRFVVTAYIPDEDATGEFLVRRGDGVTIVETWDTLGMRATGSHDVVLDGAYAAPECRLTGKGTDDGAGWMLHIPACYMGIAFAARDFALNFARTYRPNTMDKPIAALPPVQQQIGEMEIALRSARALLYEAADRWDREPEGRTSLKPELGLAKYAVTNNALRIVDLAMRIVGGASLSRSHPLERYYRDVRAGLHNPPMDNAVVANLAAAALGESMPG
ncbi:acyl-CoA/acyl-ACP dehydrogenase [Paenibacillus sp. MWE-103]|uniref:Acyl-CoA/acyl-ACP dehydrogenase n=1 Tax=Paenibacillus artemisiicola TaxID=1172618 RepID=A0ABS3W9Q3_9BACL|nr:acyl-CoA dehydrogenase family protein [Paenibacillus artemisiicola]MBO7745066.1 acyl-CoA/acyl-ACP dehydrogenase [Paenibacillus artemisiicola]